ncbi:MAG: SDR family oxidoreductase [Desulfotalea sp.]
MKKSVLIPGASRPIGRAIARTFAQKGYSLILPTFDWPESVQEMKDEFSNAGYDFMTSKVDLRKPKKIAKFIDLLSTKQDCINVLINNIERGGMPIVHGSYDLPHNKKQWQRELDTCLKAKWLLYQNCLPLLQRAKKASIVNISSIAGEIGRYGSASNFFSDGYASANAGIFNLTKTWARENAPQIRVNEISVGFIDGRHGKKTRGWKELTKKEKIALKDHILLGRTGKPKEIAKTVYFIATKAKYLTGSFLKIDGGYSLGGEKTPEIPAGILHLDK